MRLFDPSLEVFFDAFGNLIRGGGHGGHPDLSEVAPEDGGVLTSVSYYEFEGFEPTGEAEFKGRYTYDSYDYDVNAGLYEVNARSMIPRQAAGWTAIPWDSMPGIPIYTGTSTIRPRL